MTTKGPQNMAKKKFHSSKEVLVEIGETPRGPSPAAEFKHKQGGRYNLLKIRTEFTNSSNILT